MHRILVPSDKCWYDKLHTVAYYRESKIEGIIRQHVKWLFPDHILFPFKKSVISNVTGHVSDPDLAMIAKDFSSWSLIEAELTEHPLKHVLEQTQTFRDGSYNEFQVAAYVKSQLRRYNRLNVGAKRLERFFSLYTPTVLVIADAYADEWEERLEKERIRIAVLEVYKNTNGLHVYRTFGDYPVKAVKQVHCRPRKGFSNVLEITAPFAFKKLPTNREVAIFYEGLLTTWEVYAKGSERHLIHVGEINPLDPEDTYTLIRTSQDRYVLKKS